MQKKILAQAVLGLSLGMPLTALADAPKVVVDIAPLHSLVNQVMAGVAEAELIIPAESSPHEYNLRPSQARALAESELVFWMGEELTPWLEKAMDNVADSAQKVSMLKLENTVTYEFREGASFEGHAHHDDEHGHKEHKHEDHHHDDHGHSHDEHEHKHEAHHDEHNHGHDEHKEYDHDKSADKHEHHEEGLVDRVLGFFGADKHEEHGYDEHDKHGHKSHDDHDHDHDKEHDHDKHEHGEHDHHDGHHHAHHHAHEGVDPHAWLDPENAKHWLADIAATLSKKDPENAATYFANATKAAAELDQLMAYTASNINALGDLKFIVFHDAYQYFEKRFGISASGSISLGDAEDPSPARIEEIRNTVKNLGVNCVFAEPQFDQGLVKNVFDGADAAVGVMDPLGAAIAPGSQHYNALIKAMADSLSVCKK